MPPGGNTFGDIMELVRAGGYVYLINKQEVEQLPLTMGMKIAHRKSIPIRNPDQHILTWGDFQTYIGQIANYLSIPDTSYAFVTCPPGRGGLIPAARLAYLLDLPFYPWTEIPKDPDIQGICIDDIIDTGSTLAVCQRQRPNLTYCALTSRWVDHLLLIGRIIKSPEYVVFPWD